MMSFAVLLEKRYPLPKKSEVLGRGLGGEPFFKRGSPNSLRRQHGRLLFAAIHIGVWGLQATYNRK
ncbi:hypothetical protein [Ruminococcus sp. YE71]|uniref:hypothetical protein n=1 Tax=Ruminococcus sp. YE71 TaxID=244362 RepID=UPI000A43CEF1|nr:hypothetical protein [Ruminococcus sp. YE71]